METFDRPSPYENFLIWGVKIIAGLLILIFLGIHFIVNHLLAPEGLLTYADILAYYQIPAVPIMEVGFLIVVVVHALLGLRSIFLDMRLPWKFTRYMDCFFITAGIIMITYGTWLVVRVVQLGRSG